MAHASSHYVNTRQAVQPVVVVVWVSHPEKRRRCFLLLVRTLKVGHKRPDRL